MKTITEFSGFVLKDVVAKKASLLAEGKTEEEAQGAINEQLKLDETKSSLYKNVVDMTSSRMDRVKRVVVAVRATETEKVPEAYMEREGHFYLIEYFPDANSRGPARASSYDDRGGRGGGGRGGSGGGRGGSGRGGNRDSGGGNSFGGGGGSGFGGGDRAPREPRYAPPVENRPRPEGVFNTTRAGEPSPVAPRAPRPPRERRPAQPKGERPAGAAGAPRTPREPRAPRGPKGAGELRLVLKGQSQTLQGSGVAETAAPVASATAAESTQTPSA